ncbi:GAF and ANTAR domain-containing protein [Pseudokineococcus marinus]|uniref:GAF and ANTAR domain-containing protein n=1 Tax=Pseudokineococcus marinus TaxID=351215 RepID=UPI002ADE5E56|nr:GAF and ANTAR domain-containing protein [Pseudokineococcus marinus]
MDGAPRRLAEVFVELADTLVDDFDVVDFLQVLTERSVELLHADAAGLMLADQRGGLRLMTSTTPRARSLEIFEVQSLEGPCLDCFATGVPVVNVDLATAGGRWPRFAAAAAEHGYGAAHALPLRLRKEVIGAINLFSDAAVRLDDEDLAVGQSMADIATIGLLQERSLREKSALSEQLQTALSSRVLVEQAKGVLAERAGVGVDEAFTRLRTRARRRGEALSDVAAAVVRGELDVEDLSDH